MFSFSDLHKRIVDEDRFKIQLLSFLDQVIRYELTSVDTNQVLPEIRPSISAIKDVSVFALQLKDDANLIISEVQMHF